MTRLLQGWITEHAERRPSSTALVMHDEHLSYEQIEARTNQLARMLKAIGCLRGDRVALLMGKSPTAIVAILGILKADCIYVPLDPASPVPRLAHMVASAEPRCILAAGPTAALLDALRAAQQSSRSIAIAWSSTMSMRTAMVHRTRRIFSSPPVPPASPRECRSRTLTWRTSSHGRLGTSASAPRTGSLAIRPCTSICPSSTSSGPLPLEPSFIWYPTT